MCKFAFSKDGHHHSFHAPCSSASDLAPAPSLEPGLSLWHPPTTIQPQRLHWGLDRVLSSLTGPPWASWHPASRGSPFRGSLHAVACACALVISIRDSHVSPLGCEPHQTYRQFRPSGETSSGNTLLSQMGSGKDGYCKAGMFWGSFLQKQITGTVFSRHSQWSMCL